MRNFVGRKLGMTQMFDSQRNVEPVTVIRVFHGTVAQVKTLENDGYEALKVRFLERQLAEGEELGKVVERYAESRGVAKVDIGSEFPLPTTIVGKSVKVVGVSKGKGFLGVVGRHHFAGGPASHGSMSHRRAGSIGGSTYPARVIKGMRMGGHTGARQVTLTNATVVDWRPEDSILLIRGGVPGATGDLVTVRTED